MYLGYENSNKKNELEPPEIVKFNNKDRYDYFINCCDAYTPLRMVYLDCSDVVRLTNDIIEETKNNKNNEIVSDKISLLLSKFKSWIDKWKLIFHKAGYSRYVPSIIDKTLIKDKNFCLIYNLRNYQQHEGSAISYYNDTVNEPLYIHFTEMSKLISFQKNQKWKNNFLKHWDGVNDVTLNLIFVDLANTINNLNNKFSRKLLQKNTTLLKMIFDLKVLSTECNLKKPDKFYLFDEKPKNGIVDFRKMFDVELIDHLLTLSYRIFESPSLNVEKVNRNFEMNIEPNSTSKHPYVKLPYIYSMDKDKIGWVEIVFIQKIRENKCVSIYAPNKLDSEDHKKILQMYEESVKK